MEITFWEYIDNVQKNKIVTCKYIKQVVDRFEKLRKREDIYFDEECVVRALEFIGCMKHFLGKTANQPFILLPWQQFLFAVIIGLKYKETGFRVCREVYLQIARKNGKSSLISALALYFLILDGEASPQIACLATSRDQARILFEMCQNYAKSLDPKGNQLKFYRNMLKFPANNGEIKVFSSDASRLDGLSVQLGVIDEAAALNDNKLYSVIKSSQGFRTQPLMVQLTTPQFNLESPCHDTYLLSIEILAGIKEDDSFWPFLYTLDPEDEWDDEKVWVKSNPALDITITRDFIKGEVLAAKNDCTKENNVKVKNIGIWCSSSISWIPQELIAKHMQKIYLEDFKGYPCYMGADLGSVGDFTSITALIVKDNLYYFKTWVFLPNETVKMHPNKELYQKFINQKEMLATQGNVTDYDFVINKMREINEICPIQGVFYDSWNATQFALSAQEVGLPMVPFSQSVGNFNGPTKEFERLLKEGKVVIDKSSCVLWQFGNVELKIDVNGNAKPNKGAGYSKKIDSTITIIEALGGYLKNPVADDFDILIL